MVPLRARPPAPGAGGGAGAHDRRPPAATPRRADPAGGSSTPVPRCCPPAGYHDARVDDIVEAAGVSHGTFYRYFENKDDFFRVLAEAASTRMIEMIDQLRLDADVDELRAWLRDWFARLRVRRWRHQHLAGDADQRGAGRLLAAGGGVCVHPARADPGGARLRRRRTSTPSPSSPSSSACPTACTRSSSPTETDAIESMITMIRRGFLALPDVTPPMDFEFTDEQLALRENARVGARVGLPAVARASGLRGHGRRRRAVVHARRPRLAGPRASPRSTAGSGSATSRSASWWRSSGRAVAPVALPGHASRSWPRCCARRGSPTLLAAIAAGTVTGTLAVAEDGAWRLDAGARPRPAPPATAGCSTA